MFSSNPNPATSQPSNLTSAPSSSNSFFSSGANPQATPGVGPFGTFSISSQASNPLFGSAETPTNIFSSSSLPAAPSNQSIFGSSSSNQTAYGPSQSIFSSTQAPNSNQASLFGTSSQSGSLFKSQPSPSGGFGQSGSGSSTVPATNNSSGGFSFAPSPSNTTYSSFDSGPAQTNPGFGGSSAPGIFGTSSSNVGGGGFGSANGAPNSTTGGLFGSTSAPRASTPATSLFSTNPAHSSQPGPQTTSLFNPRNNNVHPNPSFSPFGCPNPGIFGQQCYIPPFEEIPVGLNRAPFDIRLTRSGYEADLIVKVNDFDVYHLSSKLMAKFSTCFSNSESKEIQHLEIETPFPNTMFEVLFWMVYSSDSKLHDYITSFKKLLEVYASINILQVEKKEPISKMLINIGKSKSLFTSIQSFPESLSHEFIDLDFLIEILKSSTPGLFGLSNTLRCAILLEWLAERNCKSLSELESLEKSKDFQAVSNFISTASVFPHSMPDYALLVSRYPVSSKVFSLQMVLKGFGLLQL